MSEYDISAKKVPNIANVKNDGEQDETNLESESPIHIFFGMQQILKEPTPHTLTPNSVLQLQRIVGNKGVQKLLGDRIAHAPGETIQRDPAEWTRAPNDDLVNRILAYSTGWFSKWKPVQNKIKYYKGLKQDAFAERKRTLDEIHGLITAWENKHQGDTKNNRVNNIRADIPKLKELIDTEYEHIYAYAEGTDLILNSPIPEELTAGIKKSMTKRQKADQVFDNVNRFRFRYTGQFAGASLAMLSHQGDCHTLALIYVAVAKSLGLDAQVSNRANQRQMVLPQPIHGRTDQSNTAGLPRWYFQEHFWVRYEDREYDLLYMTSPSPPVILVNTRQQYRGVTYYLAANGEAIIEQDQPVARTQKTGRVFRNEYDAKNYINRQL